MENLNLIGILVNSEQEAVNVLGTTHNEIILERSEMVIHGFTFTIFTYTAKTSKNFCYAVTATNLQSNQYEE